MQMSKTTFVFRDDSSLKRPGKADVGKQCGGPITGRIKPAKDRFPFGHNNVDRHMAGTFAHEATHMTQLESYRDGYPPWMERSFEFDANEEGYDWQP